MQSTVRVGGSYGADIELTCSRCESAYRIPGTTPRMLRSILDAFEADHEMCEARRRRPEAAPSSRPRLAATGTDSDAGTDDEDIPV